MFAADGITEEQVARFLAQLGITAEQFLESSKHMKTEAVTASDADIVQAVEDHLRKLRSSVNEAH